MNSKNDLKEPKVKISYFITADSGDFKDISTFKTALSANYQTEISYQVSGCGGGLYELFIELYHNISLSDFLTDYLKDTVEDGIKIGMGYLLHPLFKAARNLFNDNTTHRPDISCIKIIFHDCSIFIYSLYPNSISEIAEDVSCELAKHFFIIKEKIPHKIISIHIPIFFHVDTYEICSYRVKLDVDENIPKFKGKDFLKFWGIRCESNLHYVYDLRDQTFVQNTFYTQSEYNEILQKKFDSLRAHKIL